MQENTHRTERVWNQSFAANDHEGRAIVWLQSKKRSEATEQVRYWTGVLFILSYCLSKASTARNLRQRIFLAFSMSSWVRSDPRLKAISCTLYFLAGRSIKPNATRSSPLLQFFFLPLQSSRYIRHLIIPLPCQRSQASCAYSWFSPCCSLFLHQWCRFQWWCLIRGDAIVCNFTQLLNYNFLLCPHCYWAWAIADGKQIDVKLNIARKYIHFWCFRRNSEGCGDHNTHIQTGSSISM